MTCDEELGAAVFKPKLPFSAVSCTDSLDAFTWVVKELLALHGNSFITKFFHLIQIAESYT